MAALINVTLPVFNEEIELRPSVERLVKVLTSEAGYRWEVVIADNGSVDRTPEIAAALGRENASVRVERLETPGRGRALKRAWLGSEAEVLSYMDLDLSTDLVHLPVLIGAVVSGGCDLAVGSRRLRPDWVRRGWKREALSRGYNWLLHRTLGVGFSDAQCGFKAISRRAACALLPDVEDTGFFFDTELLVLAERRGYRILDIPVRWTDDPDSRVRLARTIWQDVRGIMRLRQSLRAPREMGSR